MSTWIISKPRCHASDAVDSLFSRLSSVLRLNRAFFMKPGFYSDSESGNNDPFFSEVMTAEALEESDVLDHFWRVWHSATPHSNFSPLLTNRLLCPIVPRALSRSDLSFPRRRLRERLERSIPYLLENFDDLRFLVVMPNLSDYETLIFNQFLFLDGYGVDTARRLANITCQMVDFSYRKMIEISGDRVVTLHITSGAGPAEILKEMHGAGLPFLEGIRLEDIQCKDFSNFYLLDALVLNDNPGLVGGTSRLDGYRLRTNFNTLIRHLAYNSPSVLNLNPVRDVEPDRIIVETDFLSIRGWERSMLLDSMWESAGEMSR